MIASAVLLAACALDAEARARELDQAHADVEALAADPLVQQAASEDLVQRSQVARVGRRSRSRATIARKTCSTTRTSLPSRRRRVWSASPPARAKAEVAKGEAERNRVLLESRTREARPQGHG